MEAQNTRNYGKLRNNIPVNVNKQHNKVNESSSEKHDKGITSRGKEAQATQVHIYTTVIHNKVRSMSKVFSLYVELNYMFAIIFVADTHKVSKWGKKRTYFPEHRQNPVHFFIYRFIRFARYWELQTDIKLPKKSLWCWSNENDSKRCWLVS